MHTFTPMLAEVSDKEPTIAAIWCVAGFFCTAGLLLCRWRRVAGLIVLPLAAGWGWALSSELWDPYVGPAMLSELGRGYVFQAFIAILIPFAAVAFGFWRRRHDLP